MAIKTIVQLKLDMPIGVIGGTSVSDIHDLLDTLEFMATQVVTTRTASYAATDTSDNRGWSVMNTAAENTFTVPSTAPVGWEHTIYQMGAGQTRVLVGGTGTLAHSESHTRTAKQKAVGYLKVISNSGTNPTVVFTGDTAL